MKLKEMIKVMQHYENGGDVEYSEDYFQTILGTANKDYSGDLLWNWFALNYRIKEQKQKVTIEKWLLKDYEDNYYVVQSSNIDKFNDDDKIKLLETYEVER